MILLTYLQQRPFCGRYDTCIQRSKSVGPVLSVNVPARRHHLVVSVESALVEEAWKVTIHVDERCQSP
jgi:hypothetical protein